MALSPIIGARVPVKGDSNVVDDINDFLFKLEAGLGATAGLGGQLLSGLKLEWLSPSSIKVNVGVAVTPAGVVVPIPAAITVTGISLGNNTWGHVYLYDDDGDPTVEVVTTDPANFFGTVYQKTGDATRRYLGSIRTDASGNIHKFLHQGDAVHYLAQTGAAPFRVLNAQTATTETNVDLSAVVPVTARVAQVRLINSATNAFVYLGNSLESDTTSLISTLNAGAPGAPSEDTRWMPLDGSRRFSYKFNTAPSGAGAFYADVLSYKFER
jgi:hypothetical protein